MCLKAELGYEAIHEHRLGLVQLDPGERRFGPDNTVDFGVEAGAKLEGPRHQGVRIEIRFHRPRGDNFSRSEPGLAQVDQAGLRDVPSGFLSELTKGCDQIGFPVLYQPLDDGPPAAIAAGEVGTTWMGYQHLETRPHSVRKKTRRSHRPRHYAGQVTLHAPEVATAERAIVLPLPTFRLEHGEPLGVGLKRLTLTTVEGAVTGFYDGEEAFGSAVHESRKATKRIRALLRLIRFEIGERAFRYENEAMRDTARMLSDIRSAAVNVQSISLLTDLYGSFLATETFGDLRDRLEVLKTNIETRAMEDPTLVPTVVERLERAHARYSSWPVEPGSREIYGAGIRNGFEAVGPGLRDTFGRGRREMVAAYKFGSPELFHIWRKRVKYLGHQMEILTPLWPEVILGMAITLDRIGRLLGEDHDLAHLLDTVAARSDLCPNPVERSLLKALAEQRRSDLQTASRILGRRIYAESSKSLNTRFEAFWDSSQGALELMGTRAI